MLRIGTVVADLLPETVSKEFKDIACQRIAAEQMLAACVKKSDNLWKSIIEDYELDNRNYVYGFSSRDNTIYVVSRNFKPEPDLEED